MKAAGEFELQGKMLHALQIYQSVIDEHPDFIEAYFGLASVYEKINNIEPAVKLFEEFLNTDPENKRARLFYGQFLIRNKRWNEAIVVMSYFLPSEEPIVSFFLGYSHFMLKEFELARINFHNFVAAKDQTDLIYEAYLYLAKTEISLNEFESALSYAKKIETVYSEYWEYNLIISIIYYNLDMVAHSIVPIEKSIKLNSKEPSCYEWAGKIYMKIGDYLKAEKYFLKFIEVTEDATSDNYLRLAEACLKGRKTKAALDYFDVAIKLDPANKLALEGRRNAESLINNMVQDG
jgi:tetratricopeptide (TPR) repeat protein